MTGGCPVFLLRAGAQEMTVTTIENGWIIHVDERIHDFRGRLDR